MYLPIYIHIVRIQTCSLHRRFLWGSFGFLQEIAEEIVQPTLIPRVPTIHPAWRGCLGEDLQGLQQQLRFITWPGEMRWNLFFWVTYPEQILEIIIHEYPWVKMSWDSHSKNHSVSVCISISWTANSFSHCSSKAVTQRSAGRAGRFLYLRRKMVGANQSRDQFPHSLSGGATWHVATKT